MSCPSASDRLRNPDALLTRSDLRELGLERRAVRRGYLGPSHATCNLRAAAEKTNGKRRDQPLLWSRVWYEPIPPNVILSRDVDADSDRPF